MIAPCVLPLVASVIRGAGPATSPVVVDSPHSGMVWPPDFQPLASREAILTTWDAHVDDLWSGAPGAGSVLVLAHFPRAYVDVNRAASDLDAALIDGPWPDPLVPSDYTRRGMGVIRRLALPGVPLYAAALAPDAVRHRLATYYHPYRTLLGDMLDLTRRRHGVVCHLDCHSMKSRGNDMNVDAGALRPDMVVSDRMGTTASPALTAWVADYLADCGYTIQVNEPYKGGDLVASFGRPAEHRHSLQIEVNRALYMDEPSCTRHEGFRAVQRHLTALVGALGEFVSRREVV